MKFKTTAISPVLVNPYEVPIETLDVSDPRLYDNEKWQPFFKRMREVSPIHYIEDSEFGPFWSICKYQDIIDAELKPEIFSSSWERGGITIEDMQDLEIKFKNFIAMDEPEHTPQRQSVMPALAPKMLKEYSDIIRKRTCNLLDGLPVDEPFDWVEEVSVELTTRMMTTLFGFPWDERHLLPHWADWITDVHAGSDPERNAEKERSLRHMATYLKEVFEERKRLPLQNDMLSLLAHSDATSKMDDQNFLGNMALLVGGASDTTRNSMSGMAQLMQQFPEAWDKVRLNRSLIPNAVLETVRLQTPLAHMRRTVSQDAEFKGHKMKEGDKVILWYLSANREEGVFTDPNTFNPERENVRRLISFGFGIHRCVGSRLAELQLATLVEEMFNRNMQVKNVSEPKYVASCFVHGFKEMMVTISKN